MLNLVGVQKNKWDAVCSIGVVTVIVIGALFLAVALRDYANDDPYITYRYARNLAQGNGFVFNRGLKVLSTTTPLYAFVLTLGYFISPNLPLLSNSLCALCLGLVAILLYRMAAAQGEKIVGVASGLLTLFFPLILVTFGAETAFYILLIIASFYWYSQERLNLAAAMAGLATLTRGDGVLVVIAMAVHFVWTRRKFPLEPFLTCAVIIAPWYLYSWLYFGSPFPATLQAKLHQSNMAVTVGFFEGIAHWAKGYVRQPIYWLYLPLMLMGVISLVRKHRWALPLMLWALLYLIGYSVLNVPRYHWYYSPLIPPLMLLVGLGVSAWVKLVPVRLELRAVAGLALVGLLLWPNLRACRGLMRHSPDARAQIYTLVGNWLQQHTSPGATVGTLEVGILGYFSERAIVDFAGLIQPEIAEQVQAGYENSAIWAINTYHPDYVVIHPGWFPTMVVASWFSNRYQIVAQFENEGYVANPLVVYVDTLDENE